MQFIDFIVCAFNQITNFLAKGHYLWNAPAPIVIRGPSGGGVHGGPFHSANPEMYFVHTPRSEEHTSELQSRLHLVCRLLLEKKKILSRAPRIEPSSLH